MSWIDFPVSVLGKVTALVRYIYGLERVGFSPLFYFLLNGFLLVVFADLFLEGFSWFYLYAFFFPPP